jgi:hypothetical protein
MKVKQWSLFLKFYWKRWKSNSTLVLIVQHFVFFISANTRLICAHVVQVCDEWLSSPQWYSVLGWIIWTNQGMSICVQLIPWLVMRRCGVWRQWSMAKVKIMQVHAKWPRVVKDERWVLIEGLEKSVDRLRWLTPTNINTHKIWRCRSCYLRGWGPARTRVHGMGDIWCMIPAHV